MKEQQGGSDQIARSESTSRKGAQEQTSVQKQRAHLTPLQVIGLLLVLSLLVVSAALSFLTLSTTHASTASSAQAVDNSCTPTATTTTPGTTATTAPVATATSAPRKPTPTPTPTPKKGVTPTPTLPPSPTTGATPTLTPSPTVGTTPAATATGTVDTGGNTGVHLLGTDTPGATPTAAATDTPTVITTAGVQNGSEQSDAQMLSYTYRAEQVVQADAQCTPTAVPTSANNTTPGTNPTSSTGSGSGGSGGSGNSQPQDQSGSGGNSWTRAAMIASLVLLGLVLCALLSWFVFRRILMPKSEVKLPPSGARPWSRSRGPNYEIMGTPLQQMPPTGAPLLDPTNQPNPGFAMHSNTASGGLNYQGAPASPRSFGSGNLGSGNLGSGNLGSGNLGFGPVQQGFAPMGQGFGPGPQGFGGPMQNVGPAGQHLGPDTHGFGPNTQPFERNFPVTGPFNGFSDNFIPPSPQIFPQTGDPGMMQPGFTPASSAFNAMYGLPEDPFSFPQNNRPGWMDGLSGSQPVNGHPAQSFSGPLPQGNTAQGFAGPPPQTPTRQLEHGEVDLNDPQLAEIIRQYSKKSQALPPPQPPQPGQSVPNPNSSWLV